MVAVLNAIQNISEVAVQRITANDKRLMTLYGFSLAA